MRTLSIGLELEVVAIVMLLLVGASLLWSYPVASTGESRSEFEPDSFEGLTPRRAPRSLDDFDRLCVGLFSI